MLAKIKAAIFPKKDNKALVQEALKSNKQVALLFLDVKHCSSYKQLYGPKKLSKILGDCNTAILANRKFFLPYYFLGLQQSGDEFHIYLALAKADNKALIALLQQLEVLVSTYVSQLHPSIDPLVFHKGFALVNSSNLEEGIDSIIYNSIKEAYTMAKTSHGLEEAQYRDEFHSILQNKLIFSHFQPIVSLQTSTVLGWEALSRGPKGQYFYSPDKLFPFAERTGLLYHLERLARESALTSISKQKLPPNSKIFININPDIVNDPYFIGGQTKKLLDSLEISPANIVFEITERTSIKDYPSFCKTLEHYRSQGYLIAIDDAGAGYSSLQSIAELKPDYIKIDLSLIRDIHKSMVKQTLIETFVTFSEKINSYLIAEGIENQEELATLIKLGVNYGQGYYLQRPDLEINPISKEVQQQIILANRERDEHLYSLNVPISYLCIDTKCYAPQVTTQEVYDYFSKNPDTHGVVIIHDQTPVGLVMREKLLAKLGSRYGMSLYFYKPISTVMDASPLIMDSKTPLDTAAQIAMQRTYLHSNDDIVLVHDQKYLGVVTISAMMLHLSKLNEQKMEIAFAANPLTGLPGNLTIHQQLDLRLRIGQPMAVIYADLDSFKIFNDTYGFEKGDEVLKYTASIIVQATNDFPDKNNFVGHIGGDDYIIITEPSLAETIAQRIIDLFEAKIDSFYDWEPIKKMSISLAIVSADSRQFASHHEVAKVAADLKKHAKAQAGSVYVKDRCQRNLPCLPNNSS